MLKPQQDESSDDDDNDDDIATDPRMNPTKVLEQIDELTRTYGYSSELSAQEQRLVISSLKSRIKHNPTTLHMNSSPRNQRTLLKLSPGLEAKLKIESIHFNKCAETFYYRHISDLKSILGSDMKSFLVNRWTRKESENKIDCNFKAITMLLRSHTCEGAVQMELENTESDSFDHKAYLISDESFLPLNKFSSASLNAYSDLKKISDESDTDSQYDIAFSIDVLAKLLVDTELFTVTFDNKMNLEHGKMKTTFNEPLPSNPVSLVKAVEESVRIAVNMGNEWNCLDNFLKSSTQVQSNDSSEASNDYHVESTSTVMTKNYHRFKKFASENQTLTLWSISKNSQRFRALLLQNDLFFIQSEDESLLKVNISIKLEYQLKFGAEKMEKSELLSEWCHQKFNKNSITLRYRVDAKSLIILSVTKISLDDIEKELLDSYQTDPNVAFGALINVLSCTQRLPEGKYKIKTAIDDDVKKLFIYKACEGTEETFTEPWTISTEFIRSWIPIDDSTTTFVHLNHQLPPCCFVPTNKRKLTSYLQPPQNRKKPATKPSIAPNQKPKGKNKKKRNKK